METDYVLQMFHYEKSRKSPSTGEEEVLGWIGRENDLHQKTTC